MSNNSRDAGKFASSVCVCAPPAAPLPLSRHVPLQLLDELRRDLDVPSLGTRRARATPRRVRAASPVLAPDARRHHRVHNLHQLRSVNRRGVPAENPSRRRRTGIPSRRRPRSDSRRACHAPTRAPARRACTSPRRPRSCPSWRAPRRNRPSPSDASPIATDATNSPSSSSSLASSNSSRETMRPASSSRGPAFCARLARWRARSSLLGREQVADGSHRGALAQLLQV